MLDEDGDEDVLVMAQNEPPALFLDEPLPGVPRHFLTVELESPGSNRFAIGARVIAEVGGRKLLRFVHSGGSFASWDDPRLHFGLGAATRVDRLTVTWPDGSTQSAQDVAADRKLRWRQGGQPEARLP